MELHDTVKFLNLGLREIKFIFIVARVRKEMLVNKLMLRKYNLEVRFMSITMNIVL